MDAETDADEEVLASVEVDGAAVVVGLADRVGVQTQKLMLKQIEIVGMILRGLKMGCLLLKY